MSNGTSEMIARSTSPRYAAYSDVSPESRPNSSTTPIRSCEPTDVLKLVMASTDLVTAVENPTQ